MQAQTPLHAIKLMQTIGWAFFAACVLLIPFAAHAGRFGLAALLTSFVLLEVVVLAVTNGAVP